MLYLAQSKDYHIYPNISEECFVTAGFLFSAAETASKLLVPICENYMVLQKTSS